MDDLLVEGAHVVGISVSDSIGNLESTSLKLGFDAVVIAVGHSARDTYQMLLSHNVDMVQKDFAVSFSLSQLADRNFLFFLLVLYSWV